MAYRLVIGNKNTSSWSLRPWIAMRQTGIAFDEVHVDLRAPDAKAQILRHSPSGKVPALLTESDVVWDSLAILEFLAEAHPEAKLWPRESTARALARSACAEMHAGFAPLRQNCAMDFVAHTPKLDLDRATEADVRRIVALWSDCRSRYGAGGQFLFGAFTAADAMYAPVISRFRTYLPDLSRYGDNGTARSYVDTMFALPTMAEWGEGARREIARAT